MESILNLRVSGVRVNPNERGGAIQEAVSVEGDDGHDLLEKQDAARLLPPTQRLHREPYVQRLGSQGRQQIGEVVARDPA